MPVAERLAVNISADQQSGEARRKKRLILALLLVLGTLALYNSVSRAPFLNYDDNAYIYENFHVRSGVNWDSITWAFTTKELSNWHPLTWLSYCLDVSVFGLNPAGPHYVNVLLHAVNAVLLFLLLEAATGFMWRSVVVAALFAIHPLNVESVAWIAERKNVLSMLFFLFALAAYGKYVKKPTISRYCLVELCFTLGLMAKPQIITLPFVLLLLDHWPLNRVADSRSQGVNGTEPAWGKLVLEKVPLLLLSAGSAWMTMQAQTTAMHLEFPLSMRLENAAISYVKYIGKTFWPGELALVYPHPGFSVNATHALAAGFALLLITAVIVITGRRYLMVGWFWFLGMLVPMIGLVQVGVQAMGDRYAYIPIIGLFVIVCWGSAELLQSRPFWPRAGFVLAIPTLIALTAVSRQDISYWSDNLTLWNHALQVTRNNFVAEDGIGDVLAMRGQMDKAVAHFQNAVKINPQDPLGNLNLGAYEQQKGNYAAAIDRYRMIPNFTQNPRLLGLAFANLGYAYYSEKKYAEATDSFHSALEQEGPNPQAYLGLGLAARMSGDYPKAAEEYESALRLQPSDLGYLLLAEALDRRGQPEGAKAARAAAERISRNIEGAQEQSWHLLNP